MPRHKNPIPTPVRDLVPQHRFPVASSLTHPQTASSALKSGLKPGRFTSPGFRPGIRRYSRTASPLLSLRRGAGALPQMTFSGPACLGLSCLRNTADVSELLFPSNSIHSTSPVSKQTAA